MGDVVVGGRDAGLLPSDSSDATLTGEAPRPRLTTFERRRFTIIWTLLLFSSLPYSADDRLFFVPGRIEQLGTAVALGVALLMAIALNRRLRVGDIAPIALYALIPLLALIPPLSGQTGIGSLLRAGRFGVALAVLVLISPLWTIERGLALGAHLRAMRWILVALLIQLPLLPFDDGRLISNLPALTAPAVGQYAAMVAGLTLLLALGERIANRTAVFWVPVALTLLLMSKTRTAMVGLLAGLVVALLGLAGSSRRARLSLVGLLLVAPIAFMTLKPAADAWFTRGQDQENLTTLTGRTKAWDKVHAYPRDEYTELIGIGLTDKSIDGLPIDNGYLAVYHETGFIGLAIIASVFLLILVRALIQPPGLHRAIALFLLAYCATASYTETGIGDMSSYVLHLVVAAVLVAPRRPAPMGPRPGALPDQGLDDLRTRISMAASSRGERRTGRRRFIWPMNAHEKAFIPSKQRLESNPEGRNRDRDRRFDIQLRR